MATEYTEELQALANFQSQLSTAIPVGPAELLAQFNASSGAFVNVLSVVPLEYLNTEHYTYVEVIMDPIRQRIEGVATNFKIVDILTSKTKIYETHMNNQCKEKIYKRFTPEVQLDILRKVLNKLTEAAGITDEAFDDMNSYIDTVKSANKVLKEAYINNKDFEFVSINSERLNEEAKLDGGLHEVMGSKNLINIGPYRTE